MRLHFLSPLIVLISVSILISCAEDGDLTRDMIRFGVSTRPLNLDPRFAADALSARLNRLLYQRLVEVDEQGLPVPGIAAWSQLSPTHYRFTLNDSAGSFPNGETVKVVDVVATYRSVLSADSTSPFKSSLSMVEAVRPVDDQRVEFILKRQDPLFPAYLELGILSAVEMEEGRKFENRPYGSGPFIVEEDTPTQRMTIRRRADGMRLQLVEVKNPLVRVLKLLRGEIDMLQNDLSPELLDYIRGQQDISTQQADGINFSYIGFNLQDPAVADLRVREAIAHAVNRKEIIDRVMRGAAREAESLFPPEHWAGHPMLIPHEYNPDRSRELLAKAGYDTSRPLHLVYKTSSDPFRIRLATIVQSQLSKVGIEIEIKSYDWGTFFGDIKAGNFQLYSLSWVGLRTPDAFRYLFASDSLPPVGANRGRYKSKAVDELLQQAENAENIESQVRIYRQVASEIQRDLAYVPLWYEDQYVAHGKRIEGYALSPDGNYDGLKHVKLIQTHE